MNPAPSKSIKNAEYFIDNMKNIKLKSIYWSLPAGI